MHYYVYRMKKDGSELNYTKVETGSFETYAAALDAAQAIYERDPTYRVEVRYEK